MGGKQSSTANWTVNDWAFGTGQNAVPLEDVVDEASQIPGKLFGAKAIENDVSMHQMQQDLLSFDEVLKRKLFFWRKKKQNAKQQSEDGYEYQDEQYDGGQNQEYYDENEEYTDQSQYPIPEEVENNLSPIYNRNNQQKTNRNTDSNGRWKCKNCAAENSPTDLQCHQCKQSGTTF